MQKTINHHTQQACNYLLTAQIGVDGIIGNESMRSINLLLAKLRRKFVAEGWEWKEQNFIAIRMDDNYTNQFTDWGIITKNESLIAFPMSTKPGWGYVKNKQYIAGKKGVACLAPGQYVNMWERGKSSWTGKPYLQQITPVVVYRDPDMDDEVDKDLSEKGLFGINFHSWKNFLSTLVGKLSAGCQVVKSDILDMIWPYIPEGKITYTLINFKTL